MFEDAFDYNDEIGVYCMVFSDGKKFYTRSVFEVAYELQHLLEYDECSEIGLKRKVKVKYVYMTLGQYMDIVEEQG